MTIKYGSIEQFKHVIRQVKDKTNYKGKDADGNPIYVDSVLPTIKFNGTVKIHGTNSGIRFTKNSGLVAQSRERDLSLTADNAGFYAYVMKNEVFFRNICEQLIGDNDTVVIYGEFAGKGIQKGVAVSELDKMFVVFGVRYVKDDISTWEDVHDLQHTFENYFSIATLNSNQVYVITQFQTYELVIDFNNPSAVQNEMIALTEKVEQECPVGKYFGVSGVGEGIVWSHNSPEYGFLQFKVKGEKHSNSKVKTLAPVDEEAFAAVKDFVATYVTESRLEQGIHVMKSELQLEPIDKNVGAFIRWVTNDTIKEEENSILQNSLDPKKIAKEISNVARKWYFERL